MLHQSRQRRLSHRPPSRRTGTRAQAACISCKEKKMKCDDQIPSCANCDRLELACLVEDPATKRQLPRNYLETLEKRVEFLQGLLQQQGQSSQPQTSSGGPQVSRAHGINPEVVVDASRATSNRGDNDDSAGLVSKAGVLSLHASGAEPQYFGASSMFSFSRIIHSCVRQGINERPSSDFNLFSGDLDSSSIGPCQLPSYDVGLELSNAYFDNVHLQYPFLHEPTFRKWENNAFALDSEGNTPNELFFINMVYSIGALLKSNSRSLPQQLYLSALLYIDHALAQKNIASIQALLCCALYSLRSSIGPSVWSLSGLALRQCIELGYHRNVKRPSLQTNILQLELRKRAFWCAYQMDCASAVNIGLPLCLPIQEVDTEFPLDIDDSCISESAIKGLPRQSASDPTTSVSHALHQFRLRCIWARIYASLYSNAASKTHTKESYKVQTESLRRELDDWMAATPPEPRRRAVPLTVFASLDEYKSTYSEALLLLYRGKLTSKETADDSVFLECMQAASDICQASKRLYIGKPINYTWSALHVIFLAGLTTVHCLWASSVVRHTVRIDTVSNTFTTCTMLLAIIAERWERAAPYRDLFEALASRAMAMLVDQDHEQTVASKVLPAVPAENATGTTTVDDLTQWANQIADGGMYDDDFGSLLNGLIGDFSVDGYDF